MRKFTLFLLSFLAATSLTGQESSNAPKTEIMTLGVFHFDYPNLDVVQTKEEDQISVFDEPFQSEIKAVSRAIKAFNPTIIAVEWTPVNQPLIDSLYMQYKAGNLKPEKNEVYQLGFRIGRQLNVDKIYCVDDRGRHYDNIEAIFTDAKRLSRFEDYYLSSRDTIQGLSDSGVKVSSIIDELYDLNRPERLKERLAIYLSHPFKYEEKSGDFTGVDFETGRWYNRNLRIFRNIQKIPVSSEDKFLLIIGAEHLNLLNLFFDVSKEFELVSPLPYLEKARL